MICGMASPIDSRNSATRTSIYLVQIKKICISPLFESSTNVSAPAFQTCPSLWLSRAMICGMTSLIDSQNSATRTSIYLVQIRKICISPPFESSANAFAPVFETYSWVWLSRAMICGMAGLIDSRNSATTTSMTFRSVSLIFYLGLRVSTMYVLPPHKHPSYCD